MKNFLIGVVSGFVLAGLTVVIFLFVLVRVAASFGEKNVKVADGSTIILKLEGTIPEKPPADVPIPFLAEQTPLAMPQVWDLLHRAATDPKVKAILLEPRGLQAGFGQMQELRQLLTDFRKSGKPLIAFLRNPSGRDYYLATTADKIYMTPEDSLDLKGIHAEPIYLKDSLDKIGVRMDVIHAGKYKDAGDMFTQTTMTPETREVLNNVLDQLFGDMVAAIAAGRKKSPEDVKALIDQGPFMADAAKAGGLVDTLAYEDQVADEVARKLGQKELVRVSHRAYASLPPEAGKRIALIVGEGEIMRGAGTSGFSEQQGIVSGPFLKLLRDVENDSTIKGAILRVDSPGGDGIASDDILHEVKNLGRKKPLVISMGDLAASGGYFISMSGDPIVAYPNTITGSIGVIFMKPNLHGLYDKLGVHKDVVERGRYSGLDSEYLTLTEDGRNKIRGQIDEFYKVFVNRVAEGRKKPFDQIQQLAQGRVWMGAQAKQNGLVDELGGLDKAIELVKKKANIGAAEKITLVTFPPKRSIFDLLTKSSDDNPAVDVAIRRVLGDVPLGAWKKGGFMKLMPIVIQVQ